MGLTPAASASIILELVKLASLIEEFGISLAHLALSNWVVECCLPRNIARQHAVLELERRGGLVGLSTGAIILMQGTTSVVIMAITVSMVIVMAQGFVVFVAQAVMSYGVPSGVGVIRVEVEVEGVSG
jgi:hypothetical protein